MGKAEKLLDRLLRKPTDFTYDEAKSLLEHYSYIENNAGRTSGSRVRFVHSETKHIIMLHRPHPQNTLKPYQIRELIDCLTLAGIIKPI